MHVHRVFDGVLVAVECPPVAKTGVTEHVVLRIDSHQHGIAKLLSLSHPVHSVRCVDRDVVPDGGGIDHRIVVDCHNAACIGG